MAHINTTGDGDIDTATAEIAVALRDACPVMDSDQRFYDEAMALRDAIMKGTRELDRDEPPGRDPGWFRAFMEDGCKDSDDRNLRDHNEGTDRGHQLGSDGSADYDDSFTGPVL